MNWLTTDLQKNIWKDKYKNGNETFEEWLIRVSGGNKDIEQLIKEKRFIFGGRILANRGLQKEGKKVTYSNCYVLPKPKDNIESIFEISRDLARTFSYGGGVGIDISNLSPNGAKVNNTAENTTGAVSFMDLYDMTTSLIGQKGRRGALMISMDVNHPDIELFIDKKTNLDAITKANISIRVDDNFMNKATGVDPDPMYNCEFYRPETKEKIIKEVNAKKLFNKLCENNWNYAEPGILFWDKIKNYNLLSEDEEFEYAAVNPCAEEPLPAGGSCLLGSFNLSSYVKNDKTFDYELFKKHIHTVVKAMNEVLDEGLPLHPLQIQRDTVRDYRQIGIGIMGLADMFIRMGVKYGSEMAEELSNHIGFTLANESILASSLLAKEQGYYPKYKTEILDSSFIRENTTHETFAFVEKYGLRNSQLLTSAPTGSISTMWGISGGIEPIFAFSYTRKTESLHDKDVYYKVYTPIVQEYMNLNSLNSEDELPEFFISAAMLKPKERILMQSAWQKHIDASISSTVNLPNEATVEQVKELYTLAWSRGLKGLTIYRDGCARAGILTIDNPKEDNVELKRGDWKQLEDDTRYYKRKLKIGCGKLNLFIGYSSSTKSIQDLYVKKKGSGGCDKLLEATVISMSGMLRLGGDLDNIAKSFEGISTCPSFATSRGKGNILSKGNTCGSAILNTIKDFLNDMNNSNNKNIDIKDDNKPKCPSCGNEIAMVEGCMTCPSCGFSKCN